MIRFQRDDASPPTYFRKVPHETKRSIRSRASFWRAAVGNHDNGLHGDSLPEQSWLTFLCIFLDRRLLMPQGFWRREPSGC